MECISGDRVQLRSWILADAPFVYDLYSRLDVVRFLGRQPRVMTELAQAETLVDRLRSVDDAVLGYWAVESVLSRELLGTVMLQRIRLTGSASESDQTEIGWHFHPDTWGNGYATEAAKLVLSHGFRSGLSRIVAVAHPDNAASHRICERIGMSAEGLTDRYYDSSYLLFAASNASSPPPSVASRSSA